MKIEDYAEQLTFRGERCLYLQDDPTGMSRLTFVQAGVPCAYNDEARVDVHTVEVLSTTQLRNVAPIHLVEQVIRKGVIHEAMEHLWLPTGRPFQKQLNRDHGDV